MDTTSATHTWPDAYRRAVAFYLRADVSEALSSLAQRRRLHFYYQTDRDYRRRDASRTRISIHCPPSARAFREVVADAAAGVTECGSPFYPFFTMATLANSPGEPDNVVGWDLCFECDLDLVGSFRALSPLLGVLEHYRVPHLAKYSGHRSLHVVVPAEALARRVRSQSLADWTRAHERIGRLFCRLVPGITATWVAVAKQQPLSAPYSLHRYNGLVGVPLTIDDALAFDPATAEVDRFAGASWRPQRWDEAGDGVARLLSLADESERRPVAALDAAMEVFADARWSRYVDLGRGAVEPVEASIFAGAVGLPHRSERLGVDGDLDRRVRRAIAALDDPDVKTMRLQRLFRPDERGIVPLAGRAEASRILAAWATAGVEGALDLLLEDLRHDVRVGCVLRAVRLFGLLPDGAELKARSIESRRSALGRRSDAVGLFLALAQGELAPVDSHAARLLERGLASRPSAPTRDWVKLVTAAPWRAEREPIKALAALGLAFGPEALAEWLDAPDGSGSLVLQGVFGGDARKLAHAGRSLLGKPA